jgi:hypothetical protein
MSESTEAARVVAVAAGVERTDRAAPVRDDRHRALEVLIGKWINEGRTAAVPSAPILTSDVYEWAPGDVLRWTGERTRSTVTLTDGGRTQVVHHEAGADGGQWAPSMDVTLRKVA